MAKFVFFEQSLIILSVLSVWTASCFMPTDKRHFAKTESNSNQLYGGGYDSDANELWHRLAAIYGQQGDETIEGEDEEEPRGGESESEQFKRQQLGMFEDNFADSPAYRAVKRGRHTMNCHRFKTFGQGYSGLC
ncbi:uncharacterized protein LOC134842442 [Symsagittifera roscoffensis]|uniref:uncharacterized protein LOC134842442 n=1 Tax=Symsagittifera roscoffensis TaxID=84072 RepID=UPI00307C6211